MRDVTLQAAQVIFLIALQAVGLVVLWLLNPITQSATDSFALFLSLELVAFAMVSYVYRARREERLPNQAWMALGYLSIVVLLVSNIALA